MGQPTVQNGFYEANGIWGRGDPPPVAGQSSGAGIILGSAACVWDDLHQLKHLDATYIAVNDIGCFVHLAGAFTQFKLRHWCSLHPEYFEPYKFLVNESQPQKICYHTNKPDKNADIAWDIVLPYMIGGTSALFATFVALGLGFDPVILAGVPLDNSPYFCGPPHSTQRNFEGCIKYWKRNLTLFNGRVKSMSGRTKELLGGLFCNAFTNGNL